MNPNLTFFAYRQWLQETVSRGYQIIPFRDAGYLTPKCIILRHDVMTVMVGIAEFLKIECDLDLVSSFYFRTRASEYNFYGSVVQKKVQDLIKTHEVGILFEGDQDYQLIHDIYGFRNLGIDVRSLSRYFPLDSKIPTGAGLDVPKVGQPLRYVYHPAYFRGEMTFVTDTDWPDWTTFFDEHDQIHVVTHPELWHAEKKPTRTPRKD